MRQVAAEVDSRAPSTPGLDRRHVAHRDDRLVADASQNSPRAPTCDHLRRSGGAERRRRRQRAIRPAGRRERACARPTRRSRARRAARRARPRARAPRDRARGLDGAGQRARDDAHRSDVVANSRRPRSACARPTSVSGGSMRPWNRPSRLAAVCPCRTNAIIRLDTPTDDADVPAYARTVRRVRSNWPNRPRSTRAADAEQLEHDHDGPRREQRASRAFEAERAATRTPPCSSIPPSTRPANQPITRQSARRRRNRLPDPIVPSIAT